MSTGQHSSATSAAGSAGANSGLAIAGFVTGLLGLLFFWFVFLGVPLGLLGIVLGAVAVSQAGRAGGRTGLAKAGIVLGVLGVVASLALFGFLASNV